MQRKATHRPAHLLYLTRNSTTHVTKGQAHANSVEQPTPGGQETSCLNRLPSEWRRDKQKKSEPMQPERCLLSEPLSHLTAMPRDSDLVIDKDDETLPFHSDSAGLVCGCEAMKPINRWFSIWLINSHGLLSNNGFFWV